MDSTTVATAADAADAPAPLPATPEAAAREQQATSQAVDRQVGLPPWQGPVTRRPAFVSETEWQVLREVARQRVDYERELLRIVNNLRFHKLLERWRAQAAAGDTPGRRALAGQLLDELPLRVRREEYSVAEAEKLQHELLAALEPDPARRAARAAVEAARLRQRLLQEQGVPVP
ncbi:MAG: hypothetical protein K0Q68_3017 [Moraxellaceae bacterium]|jgi:hypothetical protein|nr:hypothetical protein [Moraxellaceae bacterium]